MVVSTPLGDALTHAAFLGRRYALMACGGGFTVERFETLLTVSE